MTEAEAENVTRRLLPLGVPQVNINETDVCLLTHAEYITAYSRRYSMPLWSAFQLKNQVSFHKIIVSYVLHS